MNWLQGSILFAVAVMVSALVWWSHCLFMRGRVGGKHTDITVTVFSGDSPAELEQSIKGIQWLIDSGELPGNTSIVIEDAGMDLETARVAQILTRENPSVIFRKP